MTPDIRFYLRVTRSTDDAAETINSNTDRLLTKPVSPNTIVREEELTVFQASGNTAWALKQNLSTHQYGCIAERLKSLTAQSELVIRGHGSVSNNTCCGVNPVSMAWFLLQAGLKESCRINVTGCALGRNSAVPIASLAGEENAAAVGTGSFAAELQASLWKIGGLTPAVHARTVNVTVTSEGRKETRRFDSTDDDPVYVGKQKHSKIIFRIDHGGAQYMVWAY